jgi:hypothetical protein
MASVSGSIRFYFFVINIKKIRFSSGISGFFMNFQELFVSEVQEFQEFFELKETITCITLHANKSLLSNLNKIPKEKFLRKISNLNPR